MVEQDQLRSKLNAVEAQIEENQVAKEKLHLLITHCKEMKQLPPATKATVSVRKNLEKKLEEVKELGDAPFLKRSIPPATSRLEVKVL